VEQGAILAKQEASSVDRGVIRDRCERRRPTTEHSAAGQNAPSVEHGVLRGHHRAGTESRGVFRHVVRGTCGVWEGSFIPRQVMAVQVPLERGHDPERVPGPEWPLAGRGRASPKSRVA